MTETQREKPRLKPELIWTDRLLDGLVIALMIAIWAYALGAFKNLPHTIAVHFDAQGRPDGYGGKISLMLMPALATVLALGMFVINRYPHIFNYPVKITPQNAIYQYTLATRLMRWINLLSTLLLGMVTHLMIASASGKFNKFWIVMIIVFTVLMFIPFLVYLVLASSKK
ncbi:MAG: DUF1648 domain-containing protein [Bacteroidales bacterium]